MKSIVFSCEAVSSRQLRAEHPPPWILAPHLGRNTIGQIERHADELNSLMPLMGLASCESTRLEIKTKQNCQISSKRYQCQMLVRDSLILNNPHGRTQLEEYF
jgi:hypothetical protein